MAGRGTVRAEIDPWLCQGCSRPQLCPRGSFSCPFAHQDPKTHPEIPSLSCSSVQMRWSLPDQEFFLLHGHFSLHTSLLPAEILPVMPPPPALPWQPGGECQGLNTIFVTSGRTRAASGQSLEFQGSGFTIPFVPSPVAALPARPPPSSACGGDNAGQRGRQPRRPPGHGHRISRSRQPQILIHKRSRHGRGFVGLLLPACRWIPWLLLQEC